MGMVACPNCKAQTPVNAVRYINESTYLCSTCAQQQKQRIPSEEVERFDASATTKTLTLVCDNCSFENKVSNAQGALCGYCGSSSLRSTGSAAAQLLAEAEDVDTTE